MNAGKARENPQTESLGHGPDASELEPNDECYVTDLEFSEADLHDDLLDEWGPTNDGLLDDDLFYDDTFSFLFR